ncbi:MULTISPECIES: winged helix-turn-helix domain-containing protein [unclassified Novosphingobium]|uniref:protein kinase domain-containing protein n=1 Tax=unclassified Novosphingobium TaxID=2644732 RepID=UPI00146CA8BE|nr:MULTISPECIES: winged helix-turn-helix domain-containing protein [unclassified Novosphingobium]NMN06801.1 DNA-binding winged helix-turn-helix (wHTH) protein/serine/threonine protein kinase/tetratricopeptide (TPR) repeat protein [Novosphingobium sp. SG919]NMN88748.1 DNA-binding winged helix-turn-helix (wHTH) protein/serine/threonine protein kinase/tetratricopeptide (TPR) repeat protein [Novosphingobium sp. SG916]
MASASSTSNSAFRRLWTFGKCTFNEAQWIFTVGDDAVDLEGKPLEILLELLHHAGEVVTKEELLDAVWPGVVVVEGSLTTAISKLRKAMGAEAVLIETVPRIGYRLAGPVSSRLIRSEAPKALPIEAGAPVHDRPNWRFAERLDLSSGSEVWRIEHMKTREMHVLKFATDPSRLRELKRESAISRLLVQSLGERPDFVPVLDWNFASAPYWLESAYGGPDLGHWATEQGGLSTIPLAVRLELVASVASTVAAAHSIGILHKDIKPGNILVAVDRNGHWQAKVVDFGSAVLSDPGRLAVLDITQSGFEQPDDTAQEATGTPFWMAPELLAGASASVASDVFALGIMLYQIVVGDFRRPLAPGWEAEIADPLLREDIALAAAGDSSRRLDSAAELGRRLRSLPARRAERDALTETETRARLAEERLARVRARRPWVIAAAGALSLGVIATSLLYVRALHERDIAEHQTAIAEKVNRFLATDLLARSSPFRGSSPDESLVGAVKQASPLIDIRFRGEPSVAARLHQTIANALDKRSDWPGARPEYDRAAALWTQAQGAASVDAVVTRLQRAMMEARSYEEGSLPRAKAMIASAETDIRRQRLSRPDLAVWMASARGMVALIGNDARAAETEFGRASQAADALPDFDPAARLTFRQRLAFAKIRLGDGAGAERLFRQLIREFTAIEGPDGPNVLMVGMNLAQALMVEGKHAAAVAQANAVYPRMLARLGAGHEMTLQLLTTRAQSEGILERWSEAIRDDLQVHDIAVRKQGPKSFFAVATLSDAATAQCRGGQLTQGLQNAEAAHRLALEGFGKAALTDGTAYTLAACQIAAGRYSEALGNLQGIDRAAVAQLAADPNWGANVDLALAQIALAQGRTADARKYIDAAGPAFSAVSAEPYQVRLWKRLDGRIPNGSVHTLN